MIETLPSQKIPFSLSITLNSCSNSDDIPNETTIDEILETPDLEESFTPLGQVEFLNRETVDDNYILVNDAKANRVYLMNKKAELLYEWFLLKAEKYN